MSIQFNGMNELINGLNEKIEKEIKLKEIVRKHGGQIQESAQRYAPVDTGYLKRNIELEIVDGGKSAEITSRAEYAVYQEYGTRYQSGTPHMRPAFDKQKDKFKEEIKRVVKK